MLVSSLLCFCKDIWKIKQNSSCIKFSENLVYCKNYREQSILLKLLLKFIRHAAEPGSCLINILKGIETKISVGVCITQSYDASNVTLTANKFILQINYCPLWLLIISINIVLNKSLFICLWWTRKTYLDQKNRYLFCLYITI